MNKRDFLTILICALFVMNFGCTKDKLKEPEVIIVPETQKMRITKMADNLEMTTPFVFTYDTVGLLSQMSNEWGCYDEIEYDTNKQPKRILWYQYIDSLPLDTWATDIEWISQGIILRNSAPGAPLRDLYKLDSKKKITSLLGISEDINGVPDTTVHIQYIWYGNDSLKIERREIVGSVADGTSYEELFAQHIIFGKQKSPFYGINVALLYKLHYTQYVTGNVSDFCVSEYKNFHAIDNIIDYGYKANIAYTFNDLDYPLTAVITYTSLLSAKSRSVLPETEYKFFSYETY